MPHPPRGHCPKRVACWHLLGTEGDDDEHVRLAGIELTLPAGEQPDGRLVGPLAVVQEHQGGPLLAAEHVDEPAERRERPDLAELLRSQLLDPLAVRCADNLLQPGQHRTQHGSVVSQPGAQPVRQGSVASGGFPQPGGHAQVPPRGLVATRRFALGAILVYQLTLLQRYHDGADLRVGLKAFLKAA